MLSVRNLVKTYQSKKAEAVTALNNVSIDFPDTGLVFLLGKSGSGKSTLLNAIGGLDTFDSGEIIIKGKSSKDFTQSDFDSYRNTFIGFIFQEYNILENFTVHKNLALALELQGKKPDNEEINRLLEQVEMTQYAKRKPNELSGGQKQRVAIARALVKNPEIIMADEPTGALDSNTGKQVMDTLKNLSKTKLVIIVSHDREFAEIYGDRIIELKDGKILHDITKKEIEAQETASGVKVIDDKILYIKKGHKVTDADIKTITKIITDNAEKTDTFISFDKDANTKLKEGAKINDSGNKEAFLKTEPEDIKCKTYNGKSLQLIKSRLKFSDSFKMGASALKNKVGKLVFTILLSFFAFTVFGMFDALSCWNRAESVYEAMKITNTKSMILTKQFYNNEWKEYSDDITSDTDYTALKQEFSTKNIKTIVGTGYHSLYNPKISGTTTASSLNSSSDPLYSTQISGFVHMTQEDLAEFGFELVAGRLPNSNDEIAISKYTMEALIKNTENNNDGEKITESNVTNLSIDIYNFGTTRNYTTVKIVGVVDDKTDYSKYKEMDSTKRMNKSYEYDEYFSNTFLKMAYVTSEKHAEIKTLGTSNSNLSVGDENNSFNLSKDQAYSFESYVQMKNDESNSWGSYYLFKNNDTSGEFNAKYYRIELSSSYDYGSWTMYKSSDGISFGEAAYSYSSGSYSKYGSESGNLNGTELAAFKAKFGEDANDDTIPDNFVEGYYTNEEIRENIDVTYYKNGDIISNGNFVDIGKDSIIIPDYMAERIWGSDYQSKIEEGVTIDLMKSYNTIKTFNVVGVSDSYFYFSDECYNDTIKGQFSGYKMIATTFDAGSSEDKRFVLYCENGKDGSRWTVQNSATTTLNMVENMIDTVAQVFFYIAIAFAVFASLMLMNFISTSISYKKREIGVLRALGARGGDIFGIFFNESMIIAMINFLLATIATIAGCFIINSAIIAKGIEITLLNVGIRQIALILVVSAGAAFIGSFLPTFKISRKKPIDAINNR